VPDLAQSNSETLHLGNKTITVVVNFISDTAAGVTVNNQTFTLTPGSPVAFIDPANYSYYVNLVNISYLSIHHTITLQVYGQSTGGNTMVIKQPSTVMPYAIPKSLRTQSCYQVKNLSENGTASMQIYGNTLNVSEVSIAPTGAAIKINGQQLNLTVNDTQTFMDSYYADLTNVSYMPALHTVTLLVCGSESSPTQVTTTVMPSTTIAAPFGNPGSTGSVPLILPAVGVGVLVAIIAGYMATKPSGKGKRRRK
jgi:hypothetical protein